jgi:hypothetical protein
MLCNVVLDSNSAKFIHLPIIKVARHCIAYIPVAIYIQQFFQRSTRADNFLFLKYYLRNVFVQPITIKTERQSADSACDRVFCNRA